MSGKNCQECHENINMMALAYEDKIKKLENIKIGRKIICLSGSTRFKKEFIEQHQRLTLEGFIVFLPAIYRNSGDIVSNAEQRRLAELFNDIILMCDILFVINPDGYIGDSTAQEIEFAIQNGKEIRKLES